MGGGLPRHPKSAMFGWADSDKQPRTSVRQYVYKALMTPLSRCSRRQALRKRRQLPQSCYGHEQMLECEMAASSQHSGSRPRLAGLSFINFFAKQPMKFKKKTENGPPNSFINISSKFHRNRFCNLRYCRQKPMSFIKISSEFHRADFLENL